MFENMFTRFESIIRQWRADRQRYVPHHA